MALLVERSVLNAKESGIFRPDASDRLESEKENRRKRRHRRWRIFINRRESSEYYIPDESSSEEEARYRHRSKSGKVMEHKKSEQSDDVIPTSELTLRLKIKDSERVADSIMLNFITKAAAPTENFTDWSIFEESNNNRNRHESCAWVCIRDIMINDMGWKILLQNIPWIS